ncbi:Uncharacterised protein [Serratia plymuthica]|uniref:hypothetical protein n=1 Tax=Serratia plymuthica TaxID=82996 RepID=UPI00217ABF4D|nr:hypothetical protein [Serratia plymuthica]CAI0730845.1 Uncharacterised protein [Serratia plymuthica]
MAKLTKAEKKWLDEFQEVLNRCPSKRLGFYTIGDYQVVVYDRSKESKINGLLESGDATDWCAGVAKAGADFGEGLDFPAQVHSTAG